MGLLLLCVFVFVFSGGQIWKIFREYQAGQAEYDSLEQYVSFEKVQAPSLPVAPTEQVEEQTEAPDISAWPQVDFQQLSQINSDCVGWIYVEGTNINYPIVQGQDNAYYLKRLFDGTYNSAGCIFMDYRCAGDFSDLHTIIYGHHMKNGSMFAGLVAYKDQAFYEEHPVALLVTPTVYYKIQFFSGYVSDNKSNAWDLKLDDTHNGTWFQAVQEKSCFTPLQTPEEDSTIITLSTCTYEFEDAKFVLHGYVSQVIEKTP